MNSDWLIPATTMIATLWESAKASAAIALLQNRNRQRRRFYRMSLRVRRRERWLRPCRLRRVTFFRYYCRQSAS